MGRVQGGQPRPDSAYAALVVAGIAMALGGAALFGMVAYTKTPLSAQRAARTAAVSEVPPKSAELTHGKRRPAPAIPAEPLPAEVRIAEVKPAEARPVVTPPPGVLAPQNVASTPLVESLSPG